MKYCCLVQLGKVYQMDKKQSDFERHSNKWIQEDSPVITTRPDDDAHSQAVYLPSARSKLLPASGENNRYIRFALCFISCVYMLLCFMPFVLNAIYLKQESSGKSVKAANDEGLILTLRQGALFESGPRELMNESMIVKGEREFRLQNDILK